MRASPSLEEISINQRDVDQWMAMGLVKGLADKKKLLYRGTITQESIERTCEIFRIPKCVADLLLPAEEIPEEAWMDQPMHIPGEDERDFDGWFFDDDDDELVCKVIVASNSHADFTVISICLTAVTTGYHALHSPNSEIVTEKRKWASCGLIV